MKSNKGNFKLPTYMSDNNDLYYRVFYNDDVYLRYNLKLSNAVSDIKGFIEIKDGYIADQLRIIIRLSKHVVHFNI